MKHCIQDRHLWWFSNNILSSTLKHISIISVILAIAIPRLGLFISLFGALCLSALGIAFPAIIEICVLWPGKDFGLFKAMLIKNILLIVFGLLGLVAGTYVSIVDIVKSFQWMASSAPVKFAKIQKRARCGLRLERLEMVVDDDQTYDKQTRCAFKLHHRHKFT